MLLPFGLFLTLIALAPLFFAGWWGRHYHKVAFGLALFVVGFYLLELHDAGRVKVALHDYISFIALIGALYVVSGGIHITVKGEATPMTNTVFLLLGALVSNVIGTTGASMLLIRPWLRMNKYRVTGHHVVFFIFIISNVGGCLTPVGDPPLYLGYLKGVPFWWVSANCWPIWATGLGILLAMFYFVDRGNYRRAPKDVRERLAEHRDVFRFEGLSNLVFLAVVLGAAFLKHPPFARELLMVAAAAGSYFSTPKQIHESNDFSFGPIKEVAVLFIGIFATMIPALGWLDTSAGGMGSPGPATFYFGSGALSSVLDNAPTYLTFLSAILGSVIDHGALEQVRQFAAGHGAHLTAVGPHAPAIQGAAEAIRKYFAARLAAGNVGETEIRICYLLGSPALSKYVLAISAGSVFFGANTYIGNGPNFMVKAIADQQKVHTPNFLGYIAKYTLPFMAPMLIVVWLVFFRG